jgi:hypothetical protein
MTDTEFDQIVRSIRERKEATEFPELGHGVDRYDAHTAHVQYGEAEH